MVGYIIKIPLLLGGLGSRFARVDIFSVHVSNANSKPSPQPLKSRSFDSGGYVFTQKQNKGRWKEKPAFFVFFMNHHFLLLRANSFLEKRNNWRKKKVKNAINCSNRFYLQWQCMHSAQTNILVLCVLIGGSHRIYSTSWERENSKMHSH